MRFKGAENDALARECPDLLIRVVETDKRLRLAPKNKEAVGLHVQVPAHRQRRTATERSYQTRVTPNDQVVLDYDAACVDGADTGDRQRGIRARGDRSPGTCSPSRRLGRCCPLPNHPGPDHKPALVLTLR